MATVSLGVLSRVLSRGHFVKGNLAGDGIFRFTKATTPPSRWFAQFSNNNNDPQSTSHTEQQSEEDPEKTQSREDLYVGIAAAAFPKEVTEVLLGPLKTEDVEIKPDGLIYLPEIKYRRILNRSFGPGGWALMPRGDVMQFQNEADGAHLVTREYALYCLGRFVSQAMGEHSYYTRSSLSYGRAVESAKSNALMRCCKDLGVASELWDPKFVTEWKFKYATEVWCEHYRTKEKKKLWRKKNSREVFPYPWKDITT